MQLAFRTRKLKETLETDEACRRAHGADMAKKIRLRLNALAAAESLATFWPPKSGPERCHELVGDLKGHFSVDVKQPYRLLFVPLGLPSITFASDQERWAAIKSVEITGIEDTHG